MSERDYEFTTPVYGYVACTIRAHEQFKHHGGYESCRTCATLVEKARREATNATD